MKEESGGAKRDLEVTLEAVAELRVDFGEGVVGVLILGARGFLARDMHGWGASWLVGDFQLSVLEFLSGVVFFAPPWS